MELLISEESCRICLQTDNDPTSIYATYEDKTLSELITELSGVKIEENDLLSKQICNNCKNKLVEFAQFRQLCIDSDETVRFNLIIEERDTGLEGEIGEEYIVEEHDDNDISNQSYEEIVNVKEDKIAGQYIVGYIQKNETDKTQQTKLNIEDIPADDEVTQKMRQVHFAREQQKKHKCPHCDKYFLFPSKVVRHVNAVHKNLEEPKKVIKKNHACNICGKLFVSRYKVRRHMIVHDNELKIGLQKNWSKGYRLCEECNEKFHSESTFERHKLICDLLKSSLIKHSDSYKFTCVICLEQFQSHDSMTDHMKVHPVLTSPIQCSLCYEKYENQSEIIKHGRYHEENVTYQCSVCDKKYPNGVEIIAHLLRHKNYKPFSCHECGKAFYDKYKLKQHINTHDPNAPKNFICEYCDKAFGAQDYLNCHIRRKHIDEKPHVCMFCSKAFAFSHDLNVHLTTHTGERKHVCNFCDASFTKSWSLKQHISSHHRKDNSINQCQQCSFSTSNKDKFESHLASHDDEGQDSGMIKLGDPQLSSYDTNLSDDAETDDYDLVEIQRF